MQIPAGVGAVLAIAAFVIGLLITLSVIPATALTIGVSIMLLAAACLT